MAEGANDGESATILVVDDNEANRMLARDTLEDEGYRVVLAEDGARGLAAFEAERPGCVLLDVRMPNMDGFAVCAGIRSSSVGADTPVIFLTALRDVDTFDRALRAGGDDFLTKPVRPTELVVRVQTALKLRQMRAELHGHYELLKRQRDDLMRLQLQKERLTAFVVHDLKNPVGAMDLHAQILLRDASLSERARQSATHIRGEARTLSRMILNLLDLSKGDEGKLVAHKKPIDLAALASELSGELGVAAAAAKVTLETELGVAAIVADEDLLRRTLANLLENAIRHAPPGSKVSLVSAPRPEAIELRVVDAGKGVPPELRDKVFDPFVQIEGGGDVVPSRSGRGLGLAFCKLAVTAHGGRIWIEDAAPGAAFCVELPR